MNRIQVEIVNLPPDLVLINGTNKPYLFEKCNFDTVKKVIKSYKHTSVAEHVFINFNITGISRLCLQEIVRHRHASLSVQSTRYTLDKMLKEEIDSNNITKYFVIPLYNKDEWGSIDEYNDYITSMKSSWVATIERMKLFKQMMNLSNDFLKYFVPEALRVNLAWSINIRSLQNFMTLRLNKKAHFEIRYLANLILNSLKDTYVYELLDIQES